MPSPTNAWPVLSAETLEGERKTEIRIKVTKGLIALCGLSDPPRRGRKVDWKDYESDSDPKEETVSPG
jgi:hypothetical protein